MKVLFIVALYVMPCTPIPRFEALPYGCQRVHDDVTCKHLKAFPRIPYTDATTVTIGQSEFDEIPSEAFTGLSRVSNLTLYLLTVKTIKPCAFSSMRNLQFLDLMFSDVGTIQSHAFSNISGKAGGKMSLFMLNIISIRPYAFSDIDGFDRLSIDLTRIDSVSPYAFQSISCNFTVTRTNITTLGQGAFQDLKSSFVRIHNCSIKTLGCHTFDDLYEELGTRFELSSITLRCSCDIVWFVETLNAASAFFGDDIVCYEMADASTTNLTSLTEQMLCTGSQPRTCDIRGVAPPTETDVCETSGAPYVFATFFLFVFVANVGIQN